MKRILLNVAAVIAAVVVACGLLGAFVIFDGRSNASAARLEKRVIERVNTICGERPAYAERHEPTWSMGPRWDVQCPDGSRAVVSYEAEAAGIEAQPVGDSKEEARHGR